MRPPNLFEFATSELSQDAFLCWLISWAAPDCRSSDQDLHRVATSFLKRVFHKHGKEFPSELRQLEIRKQYKNIDVLALINGGVALLMEDKTRSNEHSEQLVRYVSTLDQEGYSEDGLLPVYIQNGDQGSYRHIQKAGYVPFLRRELIDILREYELVGGHNAILTDFLRHLQVIEDQVQSYMHLPPDKWEWYAWTGFYHRLQEALEDGEWEYVSNPRGGFLAFYWYWHGDDQCQQYLQLEESQLCFKIWVRDPSERISFKRLWHSRILEEGKDSSLPIVKPSRLRDGQWMTVAIVDGDYRRTGETNTLGFQQTLEVIHEAERVLTKAAGDTTGNRRLMNPGKGSD